MTLRISRRAVLGGAFSSVVLGSASAGRAAAAADGAGLLDAERAAMAANARAFMDAHRVPGLSIAIAKDRRLVYRQAFGLADREANAPLTVDHVFRIASISKPITSAALFVLIERGRLRLDDRVLGAGALLGTVYGAPPYASGLTDITVEHLLTHTAGGWPNDGTDPMFSNPQWDHAQLIGWTLDNYRLKTPPGTAYAYSNFGYCLLGRIIERLTGQSYADHVREAVLTPCRIVDMRIAGNKRSDHAPNEVAYYSQDAVDPYSRNVARMDSHGGWLATATDLLRFAVRLSVEPHPDGLLRPETVAAMTTPSAVYPRYAKGWAISPSGNWWHTGSLSGTTTILVLTRTGFCWAALCNTRDKDGIRNALDKLMWRMVGQVTTWPAGDPL
ncbi:MAG: beta-lactamase family protein [Proteobacteria bacterium]|nr:beta-lactamase family protein [Pseudomonadota bacterium]